MDEIDIGRRESDSFSFARVFSQVMVFSKSYCPYCKRAKGLLLELQKSFEVDLGVVELDILPGDDGRMIQTQLLELTGQRTVPNIFIGQKYVGGNSDLQQLHESRKLKSLLLDLLGGAPEL